MHTNFGKGNLVDGVLKLLLSSDHLARLDQSLVSLFSGISEFDVLVDNIDHQETNPDLYHKKNESAPNGDQTTLLDKYKEAGQKLKSIQKLIKQTKFEMDKEKDNLVKVHDIYTEKFKQKVRDSKLHLNPESRQVLMKSLMHSHNRSVLNPQSAPKTPPNVHTKATQSTDKSIQTETEKSVQIKNFFQKVTPEQKQAIIKSLQMRKEILES